MFKSLIKRVLQKILGFDNYLFLFSIFAIKKMSWNRHEKEFAEFMKLIPNNKGVILDVGANIGIMTATLARKFTNTQVYSFEPMPQNLSTLKKIIRYYKLSNVRIFETALGEIPGQLKMVMPVINNVKMQGLCHVVEGSSEEAAKEGILFSVPVQRLDAMKDLQQLPNICAIKIDVENFEYPVLKGAQELLQKHKPVIYCELWKNERRELTLQYLKGLGYAVKVYDGKNLVDYNGQNVTNFILVAG
jgi:FkbM family methyltransferase